MIRQGCRRSAKTAAAVLVAGILSTCSPAPSPDIPPFQTPNSRFPDLLIGGNSSGRETRPFFIDASLIPDAASGKYLPPGLESLFLMESAPGAAVLTFATARLRPGAAYLVEIRLLRDLNIDGVYPSASLFGEERRLNDFWTEGKPQTISLFFKAPPRWPTRENRGLLIKVPHGKYRLWIEALSLKAFSVQTRRPVRGAWFAGAATPQTSQPGPKSIDFVWEMPETDRLLDVTLVLSKEMGAPGPDESVIRFHSNNVEESRRLSVPVAALSPGRWTWRVEARQYRSLLAASEPSYFEILGMASEKRKLTNFLNRPGSLPSSTPMEGTTPMASSIAAFFPVGIFGAKLDDFPVLSRAGFNTIVFSPRDLPEFAIALEKAKKSGLKLLASPDFILKTSKDQLQEIQSILGPESDREAIRGERTASSNQESQLLGWYLDDEPEGRSVSPKEIFRKREFLQLSGFNQPGAIAINRTWRALDYASAVDILMPDPYPIPFEPLSWIAECLDESEAIVAGDTAKSIWSVIQAFNWNSPTGGHRTGTLTRPTTASELRAMTFLALIHGARGLFFYDYAEMRKNPALWKGLKETIADIRAQLPIFVAPTIEFGPHTFPAPTPRRASGLGQDSLSLLSQASQSPSPTPSPSQKIETVLEKSGRSSVEMTCEAFDAVGFPAVHYAIKKIGAEAPDFCILSVNTLDKPVSVVFRINTQAVALSYKPFEVKLTPISSQLISNSISQFKPEK
jgi:hypothetical protein